MQLLMRYLLTILFLFFCLNVFGQSWSITQNIGSPSTKVRVPPNGGLEAVLVPTTFTDTASANIVSFVKFTPGAIIRTSFDDKQWRRNQAASQWLEINSGTAVGQRFGVSGEDNNGTQNRNFDASRFAFTMDSLNSYTIRSFGSVADSAVFRIQINRATEKHLLSEYTEPNGVRFGKVEVGTDDPLNVYILNEVRLAGNSVFSTILESADSSMSTVGYKYNLLIDSTVSTAGIRINTLKTMPSATNMQFLVRDSIAGLVYRASTAAISPTWQETLIKGSTITQNNTILGGGFDFDYQNVDTFGIGGHVRIPPDKDIVWFDPTPTRIRGDSSVITMESGTLNLLTNSSSGAVVLNTPAGNGFIVSGSTGAAYAPQFLGAGISPSYKLHVYDSVPNTSTDVRSTFFNTRSGFITTGGTLTNYTGYFHNQGFRESGGGDLVNVGLYSTASGGQINYAAMFGRTAQYEINLGSSFNDRSLVDKRYVDSSISAGGGGSGTVTDFIFTDGNGFDGTVTSSTTTPTLSLTTTVTDDQVMVSNSGAISGSTGLTFSGNQFIVSPGSDAMNTIRMNAAGGTPAVQLGTFTGFPNYGGLWLGNKTASTTNFDILANATETIFNGPTLAFRIANGSAPNAIMIDASSRVGLSNNSPSEILDVTGNTEISGRVAIGTTQSTNWLLNVTGSTSVFGGVGVSPNITSGAGSSPLGLQVNPVFNAAASGTHAVMSSVYINAPNVNGSTSTITNTAALNLPDTSIATVTSRNYAIWTGTGANRFDGKLGVGGAPNANTLNVNGSLGLNVTSITTTTALDATHYTVLCDATSGAITVNLPTAASATRRVYIIKKTDVSANAITIDGNGSETIDGATTQSLPTQWAYFTIQSNGTAWFIIGQ
jgi:hypothetical protein